MLMKDVKVGVEYAVNLRGRTAWGAIKGLVVGIDTSRRGDKIMVEYHHLPRYQGFGSTEKETVSRTFVNGSNVLCTWEEHKRNEYLRAIASQRAQASRSLQEAVGRDLERLIAHHFDHRTTRRDGRPEDVRVRGTQGSDYFSIELSGDVARAVLDLILRQRAEAEGDHGGVDGGPFYCGPCNRGEHNFIDMERGRKVCRCCYAEK